ncbi:CBS domain-containing protein [Devosia subaequoris]|uniref:CBS domain-containing protein n=1 Tax=Devosia subaequoris TaxID=395930 RepID=A0A7W6IM57_9HYPH|nr:CBS domain-containing protein [Devosia subaequoris]MBB4052145.1 CBS domain-containing protein [Devosia subaequoris]MCP1209310.1 CBS domain-containing protein [Devosia subaequoris]
MTERRTIADFMVTDLITVSPGMDILQAVTLLLDRGVSGAPVVEETDELVGILTKKDCFKAALNAAYYKEWGGTVDQYMTRSPETLDARIDIVSAAERFLASPYRRFPVVEDGHLVGLLSRSDLLRAFVELS